MSEAGLSHPAEPMFHTQVRFQVTQALLQNRPVLGRGMAGSDHAHLRSQVFYGRGCQMDTPAEEHGLGCLMCGYGETEVRK